MNTELETAFLAAVAALPALAEIEHRTGVSGEENDSENARIIVHCPESEHVAGPLWRATINFRLESPAYDNARGAHEERWKALRSWLENPEVVAATTFPGGIALRGFHVRKSATALESNRWIGEIEIVGGVDTSV